jgi:hypothetical protein
MSTIPIYRDLAEQIGRDDEARRKFLIGLFKLALEPGPEDDETMRSNAGYWFEVIRHARQNAPKAKNRPGLRVGARVFIAVP